MAKTKGYKIGMVNKQGMLFKDLCEMYFKRCEANGVSQHTTNGYKNILKYFYEYLQYKGVSEEFYCQDFTAYTFEDFKVHIKQVRKVKDITVNSYIRKLTPMLSYGMELGYIEKFPYSYVKHQEVFKDIYTEEELKLLLKKPSEKDTTNRFAEFRNWAIINFLLGTGIRALELRELKISNVDLKEGLINLSHTKNKKPRQVPISNVLHKVLVEYLQVRGGTPSDYLFCTSYGERMPRTTLQMGIVKYAKRRGVFRYSLHLFRHTFATLFLREGGDIYTLKRLLGHSSYRMTEYYLHLAGKDLKCATVFNPLDKIKVENTMIKKK